MLHAIVNIKIIERGQRPAAAAESGGKCLHPLVADAVVMEVEPLESRQRPAAKLDKML